MGQYFRPVNIDKHEYVCPWCIGGGAKLWEWAANTQGAIFTLLLRKSDQTGGGDFYGYRKGFAEGGRVPLDDENGVVGRWAGDRIVLVGDYDSSRLFETCEQWRNISQELVEAWNAFIGRPELQLESRVCSSCEQAAARPVQA